MRGPICIAATVLPVTVPVAMPVAMPLLLFFALAAPSSMPDCSTAWVTELVKAVAGDWGAAVDVTRCDGHSGTFVKGDF